MIFKLSFIQRGGEAAAAAAVGYDDFKNMQKSLATLLRHL